MYSEIDYLSIGKRVREARNTKNITQEKLAELIGSSLSHMSNIENGKTKLSLPAIVSIANALSCSVDELLFGNLTYENNILDSEITKILNNSDLSSQKVILDVVHALKNSLDNNY